MTVAEPAGTEAEWIAKWFHYYYEDFAPSFGYETRKASKVPWPEVPEQNRKLMICVVETLMQGGIIRVGEATHFDGSQADG
jgi:hypothetical protein